MFILISCSCSYYHYYGGEALEHKCENECYLTFGLSQILVLIPMLRHTHMLIIIILNLVLTIFQARPRPTCAFPSYGMRRGCSV